MRSNSRLILIEEDTAAGAGAGAGAGVGAGVVASHDTASPAGVESGRKWRRIRGMYATVSSRHRRVIAVSLCDFVCVIDS